MDEGLRENGGYWFDTCRLSDVQKGITARRRRTPHGGGVSTDDEPHALPGFMAHVTLSLRRGDLGT